MRYLKKFNEELKPSTYRSAAHKLKKLGHERRSKELEDWGKLKSSEMSMKKWEELKQEWSSFGKATYRFMKVSKEVMRGDFYLFLTFDDYMHLDSIPNNNRFSISFSVGLIPVDEDNLKLCRENLPENFNGFYWGNWVNLYYSIKDEVCVFDGIKVDPYDEGLSLEPELVDRKSAVTLKKHLLACFDESVDYPADYTTNNMHDLIFTTICQRLDMQANYNLSMDSMANNIRSYSNNLLFKD
jgi:hypothetical protein